jgi:hypothetical protein
MSITRCRLTLRSVSPKMAGVWPSCLLPAVSDLVDPKLRRQYSTRELARSL